MSAADVGASEAADVKFSLVQISFSKAYVTSPQGILKAAETVLSLIAFICVAAARIDACDFLYGGTYNFFEFVTMSAFLTGLVLYFLFVSNIYDKLFFKLLPWHFVKLGWTGVYVIFYLIGSSVIAAQACMQPGNKAAAVFGFVVLIGLGADLTLVFKEWRGGRQEEAASPQGADAEKNEKELY